ncbi:YopX family protein [Globicatella sanguinis]
MIQRFRAWHIHKQIMCEVIRIDFKQGIVTLDLEPDDDEYYWTETDWNTSHVILMQSTGLKDKNNKEIFEGDIVIAWSQGIKGAFEINRRVDGLWLLYPAWKDGQFWYLSPTEDGQETCEVIGSIYENKELWEVIK